MHHPKSTPERVEIEPEKGGLGIVNIRDLHASQINNLRKYFYEKSAQHQMFKVICNTDEDITPLSLFREELEHNTENNKQELITTWKQKKLHGTHAHQLDQEFISKMESNVRLKQGSLYGERVEFMRAIQDRVTATKNYRKYILKEKVENDKCRKCKVQAETIEHVISGCTAIANTEYLRRHENVAKIIHQQLAEKYKLLNDHVPYCKYDPANVIENNKDILG
jgi:hypothetical protein